MVGGNAFEVASGCPPVPITISIGIAQADPKDRSAASLLAAADRGLYDAKARGRDTVTFAAAAA